jgi:hypothetical protein
MQYKSNGVFNLALDLLIFVKKQNRMRKFIIALVLVPTISFCQLDKLKKKLKVSGTGVSQTEIANGIKEALENGVSKQVSKLALEDGFFKNELVKIAMPEEALLVEKTLRKIGMGKLADEGILAMNRAAEDAIKEATPVLVSAIKNMTVADAKNILMGDEKAATTYLKTSTQAALLEKFKPIVQASISKVGADVLWEKMINAYNKVPLVNKVNPDLTDYTTQKTLDGAFTMVAVEEKNIRTSLNSRTSALLKKIFAMQDKK